MVKVSLTSWLDPALAPLAKEAGISKDEYVSYTGGEAIGTVLEQIAGSFTTGWTKRVINLLAGLIAGGYAVYGDKVPPRLRKELIGVANHELLRLLELRPNDLVELWVSIQQFFGLGRVQRMGSPMPRMGSVPSAVVNHAIKAPTTVYGTAPVGRYQITG